MFERGITFWAIRIPFFFNCFGYSSQEKVWDVSATTILSLILGIRVKKESQLLPPSFYEFCYSNQGKVEHVSAIIIRFLLLWSLKSREIGGRLSYYHSFPIGLSSQFGRKWRTSQLLSYFAIALSTQVKRKWRTSQLLLCFFCGFGYSSVKDVSAIIIFLLLLWVLQSS